MTKLFNKVMCKKDEGGLNQLLVEAGLAVVGIALLVVLSLAAKPLLEEIVASSGEKIKNIFTMF